MQDALARSKSDLKKKPKVLTDQAKLLKQGALDSRSLAEFLVTMIRQNPDFDSFGKDAIFPPGAIRAELENCMPGLFQKLSPILSVDALKKIDAKLVAYSQTMGEESSSLRRNALLLTSNYAPLFKMSTPTLQATLADSRSKDKADHASTRGFGGITIQDSQYGQKASSKSGRAVLKFINPRLGLGERAAMIGFDIGAAGHEVAIRVDQAGTKFLFMDPNYGLFVGVKDQVNQAFDYLFSQDGGIYNNPDAADGGKIQDTFDFTIFKAA